MLNNLITDAYIGLGSNLQNPFDQVLSAIDEIALLPASKLITKSSLYLSKPMGPADQPSYVNAVVQIETRLEAEHLLHELQAIEQQHGRTRKAEQWGPRTLDLDILVYGKHAVNNSQLVIPHPGIRYREFVLYPLHEVNKHLMIPGMGKINRLRSRCHTNGMTQYYA